MQTQDSAFIFAICLVFGIPMIIIIYENFIKKS